jgi:osmotically-inducible protein OsmY
MAAPERSGRDPDHPARGQSNIGLSVAERLQRSGYAALGQIHCEFQPDGGVLNLSGSVPSYYLKQLAQELAADLEGVRLVDNQIQVVQSRPAGTAGKSWRP